MTTDIITVELFAIKNKSNQSIDAFTVETYAIGTVKDLFEVLNCRYTGTCIIPLLVSKDLYRISITARMDKKYHSKILETLKRKTVIGSQRYSVLLATTLQAAQYYLALPDFCILKLYGLPLSAPYNYKPLEDETKRIIQDKLELLNISHDLIEIEIAKDKTSIHLLNIKINTIKTNYKIIKDALRKGCQTMDIKDWKVYADIPASLKAK